MSTETNAAPKKSILTDAMERARVIKDAKKNGEDVRTPEEIAARRTLKKAALVVAGLTAATITAFAVASKLKAEDETSDEDAETTED